jgi:hypothetical protein
MVGGKIWSMGSQEADEFWPSTEVPNFWYQKGHYSKELDPQLFDGRECVFSSQLCALSSYTPISSKARHTKTAAR